MFYRVVRPITRFLHQPNGLGYVLILGLTESRQLPYIFLALAEPRIRQHGGAKQFCAYWADGLNYFVPVDSQVYGLSNPHVVVRLNVGVQPEAAKAAGKVQVNVELSTGQLTASHGVQVGAHFFGQYQQVVQVYPAPAAGKLDPACPHRCSDRPTVFDTVDVDLVQVGTTAAFAVGPEIVLVTQELTGLALAVLRELEGPTAHDGLPIVSINALPFGSRSIDVFREDFHVVGAQVASEGSGYKVSVDLYGVWVYGFAVLIVWFDEAGAGPGLVGVYHPVETPDRVLGCDGFAVPPSGIGV